MSARRRSSKTDNPPPLPTPSEARTPAIILAHGLERPTNPLPLRSQPVIPDTTRRIHPMNWRDLLDSIGSPPPHRRHACWLLGHHDPSPYTHPR
jgi:hypothetical protein